MTQITIKQPQSSWKKTDFLNDEELLGYLLSELEVGKLKPLSTEEIDESRKKTHLEVNSMNEDEFIDINHHRKFFSA